MRNVVATCLTDGNKRLTRNRCTAALAGKQLAQQAAVFTAVENLHPRYAVFQRAYRRMQQIGRRIGIVVYQFLHFADRQRIGQRTVGAADTGFFGQENQLFRLQSHGHFLRSFAHAQIEGFTAVRMPQRADKHHRAAIQAQTDFFCVDFADGTGIAHVHAVDHAQRTGCNKVAASDNRRLAPLLCGYAAEQGGFHIAADNPRHLLHFHQSRFIGNPSAAAVFRNKIPTRSQLVEQMPRTVYQDQTQAQAGQQIQICGQTNQGFTFQQAVGHADHHGFAAQILNIGRGFAKAGNKMGDVTHSRAR